MTAKVIPFNTPATPQEVEQTMILLDNLKYARDQIQEQYDYIAESLETIGRMLAENEQNYQDILMTLPEKYRNEVR